MPAAQLNLAFALGRYEVVTEACGKAFDVYLHDGSTGEFLSEVHGLTGAKFHEAVTDAVREAIQYHAEDTRCYLEILEQSTETPRCIRSFRDFLNVCSPLFNRAVLA